MHNDDQLHESLVMQPCICAHSDHIDQFGESNTFACTCPYTALYMTGGKRSSFLMVSIRSFMYFPWHKREEARRGIIKINSVVTGVRENSELRDRGLYSHLHAQDIIRCTLRPEICARWGRKLPMNKNRREVIRGIKGAGPNNY